MMLVHLPSSQRMELTPSRVGGGWYPRLRSAVGDVCLAEPRLRFLSALLEHLAASEDPRDCGEDAAVVL